MANFDVSEYNGLRLKFDTGKDKDKVKNFIKLYQYILDANMNTYYQNFPNSLLYKSIITTGQWFLSLPYASDANKLEDVELLTTKVTEKMQKYMNSGITIKVKAPDGNKASAQMPPPPPPKKASAQIASSFALKLAKNKMNLPINKNKPLYQLIPTEEEENIIDIINNIPDEHFNLYINEKDPNTGKTPLMLAAEKEYVELFRVLIDCGAEDNDIEDDDGFNLSYYITNVKDKEKMFKMIDLIDGPIRRRVNSGSESSGSESSNYRIYGNAYADYLFENYKHIFSRKEYDEFRKLIVKWVEGILDRTTRLYDLLARLPGVTRTVYRGQKNNKQIHRTKYFATSTNEKIANTFGENTCCKFIIHLVNVPAYYVDYSTNENNEYENEYLVLGGGTFWKNKECTVPGYIEIKSGLFECWYSPPNLGTPIIPVPRAIATRNEDYLQVIKAQGKDSFTYSIREIHPLAVGIQNSKTAGIRISNLLNNELPQAGYACNCKKDEYTRLCILWDTYELGNFSKELLRLGVYMILTTENNLLITTCEPASTIMLAAKNFLSNIVPNHIIIMGDIPENTITIAGKTMIYTGCMDAHNSKIFSTYNANPIENCRADTFQGQKTMKVSLVTMPPPPVIMSPPPPPLPVCTINKNQVINGELMPNTQKGSNPGGIFIAENNCKYYLKEVKNIEHAEQEVLASKLYQAAGIKCADVELAMHNNKPVLLSSWIESTSLKKDYQQYFKKLWNGFAIDAWLANRDVVGESFDNFIIDDKGEVIRIDTGGALEYRAMGANKEFSDDKVEEFFTLRDSTVNKNAADVFKSITIENLRLNLQTIEKIQDETIIQIVAAHITSQKSGERLIGALISRRKILINMINKILEQPALENRVPLFLPPPPQAAKSNQIEGGTKKRITKGFRGNVVASKRVKKTKKRYT